MFEFEDNLSIGFHDVFLSKYSDASCPILDFYISDSMQDIRTEVATVVGGASEFSSLMSELPTLDLETSNDGETPWLGGPKWSSTSSSHDLYADVGACVNPNSVMPAINNINSGLTSRSLSTDVLNSPKSQLDLNTNTFKQSSSPLPSPKEKKSHLTFSPNIIKVPVVQEQKKQSLLCQAQRTSVEAIKKDLSSEIMKDEKIFTSFKPTITTTSTPTNTIKLAPGIGGLTFANSLAFTKLKNNSNAKIVTTNGNVITTAQQLKAQHIRSSSPSQNIHASNNNITIINNNNNENNTFQRKFITTGDDSPKVTSEGFKFVVQNGKGTLIATTTNPNAITSSVNTTTLSSMQQHAIANGTALKPQPIKLKVTGPEYPKPAYSYSCLIAMALKNSRAGSLPVSEIYSFMCEHFPYFKTAPNGWKNSVRHNLSLNKCFEKIEKPATNGGQRKGCLWAMNPSKIAKMDEEVQKWSRKDPMAIRKAMVIPENLPALERGEMKHGSLNDSDVEPDDTEDSEPENEMDDSIVNTIVPDVDSCDDEENSQAEYDVDVSDMFDEVDIEDSKSIQFALNAENGQTEFFESDIQPSAKRARLDINYSIAPARTFSIANNMNGAQIIQKTSFAGQVQHQLLQQQQNRRKVTLVNRTA